MGIGPVEAIHKALKRSNKVINDVDIFELNEAFAQSIAVNRELQLPQDKVNVNGGAIALGHPIGFGCAYFSFIITSIMMLSQQVVMVAVKVSLRLYLNMKFNI